MRRRTTALVLAVATMGAVGPAMAMIPCAMMHAFVHAQAQAPQLGGNAGRSARQHAARLGSTQFRPSMRAETGAGDFATYLTATRVRVFAISDLHADYKPNMEWMKNLPSEIARGACQPGCPEDDISVLMVAGDVASDLDTLKEGLGYLKEKFDEVVFVPGNHELWCQRGEQQRAPDSMVKLQDVKDICSECKVHTKPLLVQLQGDPEKGAGSGRVVLLPFLSWYHASFDREPELPRAVLKEVEIPGIRPFEERWADFKWCAWPEEVAPVACGWNSLGSDSQHLAEAFAALNEEAWLPAITAELHSDDTIISMSHFVPRLELVPEKRFLVSPELPKVVGSEPLERQIREIKSQFHIFGHTHLPVDLGIEGVRYLQWSLGMQRKGKDARSCKIVYESGPLLVFDSRIGWCSRVSTLWGDYYRHNARDVSNTTVAPWVKAFAEDARRRIAVRRQQAGPGASAAARPARPLAPGVPAAPDSRAPTVGGVQEDSDAKAFDAAVEEAHRVGRERNGLLEDYSSTPSMLRQSEGAQEYIRGDINNQIRKQREWLDLDRS